MAYAENTSVSVEKSKAEIERTLRRYGADQFLYGTDDDRGTAVVGFRMRGRHIRFFLDLSTEADREIARTETGRPRAPDARRRALDQAVRQRWRALCLIIKGKLEAVESGVVRFEEEFLAQTMLPDGSTVGEFTEPQVERAYTEGVMPSLLPFAQAQLVTGEVVETEEG